MKQSWISSAMQLCMVVGIMLFRKTAKLCAKCVIKKEVSHFLLPY